MIKLIILFLYAKERGHTSIVGIVSEVEECPQFEKIIIDNDYQLTYNYIKQLIMIINIAIRRYSMTLDNIKPGQGGVISTIGGQGLLRRRLLDMGLTPNTRVKVRKVAPMGDPIELSLRSYVLTIRKEEAAKIELKEVFGI